MLGFYLVMGLGLLISALAGVWVKSSYSKYSKQRSYSGMTGAEVARTILDRNGLTNVRVEPVAGQLTDHYDPSSKVVRLSEGNFAQNSIAAVSVAAHEVGHAIQDATGYLPMKARAGLFPVVNFSNQLFMPLLFGGFLMGGLSGQGGLGTTLIQIAAVLFIAVFAFHVVTLPVEINASTRAYGLLTRYGILSHNEAGGTKRVLTAAAFTYIAAALTSLLTLVYLLLVSRD
ncbi:MAG: flagellar biosynthesis protein FlgM [Actinobacteria bacterium]|jgi:Zn-dependent membrane protease YugP|nr:zinc metallopeptidase [Actinomycetota bacterium]PLS84789.1 MAG: flagellar biosynthesis protein FlgM [Actinomycetota bacterium]